MKGVLPQLAPFTLTDPPPHTHAHHHHYTTPSLPQLLPDARRMAETLILQDVLPQLAYADDSADDGDDDARSESSAFSLGSSHSGSRCLGL